MPALFDPEQVLGRSASSAEGRVIGRSREGRPLRGFELGAGPLHLSLIGGCHADEPVGPEMLSRLVGHLLALAATAPALSAATWYVVPHANPDGAARNAAWTGEHLPVEDHLGAPDRGFDVVRYVESVVREAPGDDIEFGFPRGPDDDGARPENRAVAEFLAPGAPFALHGSFHGMAFAPGPWYLIEPAWIDRTAALRRRLRRRTRLMGYDLTDWDRGGEKGFERIGEGFSTRPDSAAMARYFRQRDDPETAALFRPSSMEHVRSLGGDPFTFVSEMPLFLYPDPAILSERREAFRAWLASLGDRPADERRRALDEEGLRPMPIGDQMRLQLELLLAALDAVSSARPV